MNAPTRKLRPPAWAERILAMQLPVRDRAFILADLEERFSELAARSRTRATLWYWRQTLRAWRPLPSTGTGGGSGPVSFRHGLRALVRSPGPSLVAVVTLGIGIGGVGTAFSILWGTVLNGLPFEEADRLVHFERANLVQNLSSMAVTPHDYRAWQESQRSFEGLGAYVEAAAVLPTDGGPPERYFGVSISANAFDLLGVRPALGRGFGPEDEQLGAERVVLLSHALWESHFGSDPDLVGSEILLNDRPTTVIGIMPERFGFPIAERFWLPLRLDLGAIPRGAGRLDVFGRLRDGVALEDARAEMDAIGRSLQEAFPAENADILPVARSFTEEYVGPEFVQTVYRLLAGAILVLLVCCANVANLLLLGGMKRTRDLAIRLSVGATRGRLIRQLLSESAILAGLGAIVGVGLAAFGVSWFNRAGAQAGVLALPHGSDSLFWWDVSLNVPTLIIVVLVTVTTAVAAGLAPALRASRAGVQASVGARGAVRSTAPFTTGLTVVQVGLTTALLVAAGFVGRSALNVSGAFERFDAENVFVSSISLPGGESGYPDHTSRLRFSERWVDALEARPEVVSATATTELPLDPPSFLPVMIEREPTSDEESPLVGVASVSPDYFATFEVVPIGGRTFGDADRAGSEPVAVVNRSFVTRHLNGRDPLSSRIRIGTPNDAEPWLRIVGVVPDLWERPGDREQEAGVYLPLAQSEMPDPGARFGRFGFGGPTVAVRLRDSDGSTARWMSEVTFALDPSIPRTTVRSMQAEANRRFGRYRVWGRFYLTFAGLALFLAGLGVYGVLSTGVTMRTAEIGVRRALGASGTRVRRSVVRDALVRIGVGCVLGLLLGAYLVGGLRRVLYDVESTSDPFVFIGVAGLLVGVGLLASWVPARRASAIEPVIAMREG